MKNLSFIFATVLLFAGVTVSNAADNKTANHNVNIGITTHALVDIEALNGSTISLSPKAPTEAGLGLDFTNITNSDLWLNYSSIVSAKNKTNSISVSISEKLPKGVLLKLAVSEDNGDGKIGKIGTAAYSEPKALTTKGFNAVDNIGSGYTGTGVNNGHNLTYSLVMDDNANYEDIVASSPTIEVTYTITEK